MALTISKLVGRETAEKYRKIVRDNNLKRKQGFNCLFLFIKYYFDFVLEYSREKGFKYDKNKILSDMLLCGCWNKRYSEIMYEYRADIQNAINILYKYVRYCPKLLDIVRADIDLKTLDDIFSDIVSEK